jgi:hypothetical protein
MNAIPPKPEDNQPTPEPQASQTRDPVIASRLGRGRLGGSTICDLLIQRGRRANRAVLVADGDRLNPTLSALYPPGTSGAASQPKSDDLSHVKEWINERVDQVAMTRTSMVLDIGGGNQALADNGHDLPMATFCEEAGIRLLPMYFCGPEKDDFDHIVAIHKARYFRSPQSILFLNESLMRVGQTAAEAFAALFRRPELKEMAAGGTKIIYIPRLPCLAAMREEGLGFYDAAANKPGKGGMPMSPTRQFMVKTWLKRLEQDFIETGVAEWLP